MNVKPINGLSPYTVNTANEARDERGKICEALQPRNAKKKNLKVESKEKPPVISSAESEVSPPPESSQIVDSATLIELLNHQPKPAIRQNHVFLKNSSVIPKTDDKTATSDVKKVNKTL